MSGILIVYDGECPFCANYVTITRLKASVGDVVLLDARTDHPFVREIKGRGLNLNKGMVASFNDKLYHGADCLHLLALLSSRVGWRNRTISVLFSNKLLAGLSYPVLRACRNLTLRIMGREKII